MFRKSVDIPAKQKPMTGFEPATYALRVRRSTTELHRHQLLYSIAKFNLIY